MADTSRIPQNPADWTFEHARSAVPVLKPEKGVGDGLKYLSGDNFQDAEPWIGPSGDKEEIRSRFVSIPELVSRVSTRVNGACGNEADIWVQPVEPADKDAQGNPTASPEQQRLADEWRADFGAWWSAKNLWGGRDVQHPEGVRGVVAYASAHPSGRACLRAFFNPAARTEQARDGTQRIPKQSDRRSALRHINVVAPPPDRCTIYTDPDTHQKVGVFLYTDSQDRNAAEIWYSEEREGRAVTILRQVVSGAEATQPEEFPWDGFLPIEEAHVGCILTSSVCRLQAGLDFGATALHRNQEFHGWGQRTEINSEEDGDWRQIAPSGPAVPRTRQGANGTEYFWPINPTLGVRTIRRLTGIQHQTSIDETAAKEVRALTTPSVHYHEPSDPEAILKGMRADLSMIRDSCHQGHITDALFGSTAEASGDAYEQKRADFEQDVKGVSETVDNMLSPFATVVTLMADWTAGDDAPQFAREWTVKAQGHPSAGPVSTERQTTTAALEQAGIISPEEATARVGVQDVQEERKRIEQARTVRERAEDAKALIDSGADPVAAWIAVGFTEEQAKAFARTDGPPFVSQ